MDKKVEFEQLTSQEQIDKLRSVMDQIKKLEMQLNANAVISGNFEIQDISFTRLSNGDAIYDVKIGDAEGNVYHSYYNEKDNVIEKIDVEDKKNELSQTTTALAQYQSTGMDLTELNNSLVENKELLQALESPEKISLNDLEIIKQELMDVAIRCGINPDEIEALMKVPGNENLQLSQISPEELQQFEDTFADIGLTDKEIMENVKVDEKGITLKSSAIAERDAGEIKGNDKVTTNYTLNQVLGLNYDSYRIIKSKDGEPVVIGFTQDGRAENVPNGAIEANSKETKSMSLIMNDGSIVNASVVASFRVRDAGSSISRDQAIGIYSYNGRIGNFYARNAGGDKLIGEELPGTSHTPQRIHSENMLDMTYNKDLNAEAKSADNRVSDGCKDDVRNIGDGQSNTMIAQEDSSELIRKYADYYDIDENELEDKFEDSVTHDHSENMDLSDEQIIIREAEELKEEQEKEEEEKEQQEKQEQEKQQQEKKKQRDYLHEPDFPEERTLFSPRHF